MLEIKTSVECPHKRHAETSVLSVIWELTHVDIAHPAKVKQIVLFRDHVLVPSYDYCYVRELVVYLCTRPINKVRSFLIIIFFIFIIFCEAWNFAPHGLEWCEILLWNSYIKK